MGPHCLWIDTAVCVVGVSFWLLQAPRSVSVGGGKMTRSVPGGSEAAALSSDPSSLQNAHVNPFLSSGFLEHKWANWKDAVEACDSA